MSLSLLFAVGGNYTRQQSRKNGHIDCLLLVVLSQQRACKGVLSNLNS